MSSGENLLHVHMRITLDFTVDIVDDLDEGNPQKRLLRNLIAHGRNEQHTLREYLLYRLLWDHFADKSDWYWLDTFFEHVDDDKRQEDVGDTILAPILALDPSTVTRYGTPDGSPGSLFTEEMDDCIKTELARVHIQDTLQGGNEHEHPGL